MSAKKKKKKSTYVDHKGYSSPWRAKAKTLSQKKKRKKAKQNKIKHPKKQIQTNT